MIARSIISLISEFIREYIFNIYIYIRIYIIRILLIVETDEVHWIKCIHMISNFIVNYVVSYTNNNHTLIYLKAC